MSAIYLAQQERPRRSVAVKVLRPQLLADPRQWPLFLARFRREADATAALDHANIVPIFEFGEQDDLAYLVMPYLPDGSLGALLDRDGQLPMAQALNYVDQIAAALDYAHQHGIIHRDVKPSNLLLHPDGRLLLADFGIARPLDQRELPQVSLASDRRNDSGLTVGGVALGTPDYMSPEQIRGERVGPATDIYALGVVTYSMMTGRAPFGGGPTQQVLARQLNDAPPPLRIVRPDVPQRMEEVVFWALAKDANERPNSAGAFAQAMRDSSHGALGALWKRAAAQGASLAAFRTTSGEVPAAQAAAFAGFAPTGDATLYDPAFHPQDAGADWVSQRSGNAAVAWPGASARGAAAAPERKFSPALIAAVTAAIIILVAVAVVAASALGSTLGAMAGGPGTAGAGLGALHGTPTATATPSPTPSPTVPPLALTVNQSSVTLTCYKPHKTAVVRLTNTGGVKVNWTTSFSTDGSPGVTVSPNHGYLDPGSSTQISITNATSIISNSNGVQGTIDFVPSNSQNGTGSPAVVSYTADGCFFGG